MVEWVGWRGVGMQNQREALKQCESWLPRLRNISILLAKSRC